MRQCLRVLLAAVLLLGPAASAGAATIQDLVKLKAAGLSDDILIALIESDGSVFQLKADDVISLRKQGLSERVIMAMLVTATKRPAIAAGHSAGDSNAGGGRHARRASAAIRKCLPIRIRPRARHRSSCRSRPRRS